MSIIATLSACAPVGTNTDTLSQSLITTNDSVQTTGNTNDSIQTPSTPTVPTSTTNSSTTTTGRDPAFMALLDHPGISPDDIDPIYAKSDRYSGPPKTSPPLIRTLGLQLAKELQNRLLDKWGDIGPFCICPKEGSYYCRSDDDTLTISAIESSKTPYLPDRTNWFFYKEPGGEMKNTIVTFTKDQKGDEIATPIYDLDKKVSELPFVLRRDRFYSYFLTYNKGTEYSLSNNYCMIQMTPQDTRHVFRMYPLVKNAWSLFVALKKYFNEVTTFPALDPEITNIPDPNCGDEYSVSTVMESKYLQVMLNTMAVKKPLSSQDISGTYDIQVQKGDPPTTYTGKRWIKKFCLVPGIFLTKHSGQSQIERPRFEVVTKDGQIQDIYDYLEIVNLKQYTEVATKISDTPLDSIFEGTVDYATIWSYTRYFSQVVN
ncbi:MAG: hypothetical protein Q8P11_00305 [bacterium]|nr:hypothetical protein [bacterium]